VRDKRKLTTSLVTQFTDRVIVTADEAYSTWWHNLRSQGGMRLTKTGYEAFVQMDLEHYDFAVDPMSVTSRLIIAMDRKLQMPYYILFKKQVPVKIIFFGSQEAVWAKLYGDIRKFIDNYQP
jgi:hypothetical protein